MKITLVGASGFVGLHLVQALSRAGHECVVITRQASLCRPFRQITGTTLEQVDAYDVEAMKAVAAGSGAMVCMPGILNERGSDGSGFRKVHVELARVCLEAAGANDISRFIHLTAINAGKGKSHYLQTKGEAEDLVRGSGLNWSIYRPSVIFGPGDGFFGRFSSLLRMSPILPLACPGAKMQPVYVKDVATAVARTLDDPSAHGEVFELGGPGVYTLQELVKWTAKTLGLKRAVPGLPNSLSRMQAAIMNFVPGKPFSTDNYLSLQLDNVTDQNALPSIGIQPASIEAVVPALLGVSPRQQRLGDARRGDYS